MALRLFFFFFFFSANATNSANKPANVGCFRAQTPRTNPCRRRQSPAGTLAPLPHQTPLCVRSQLSAMLSSPGTNAASRNTGADRRWRRGGSYLGDGLLVPHDSLLDERVDFNVPVPARHHHPGPAEAHGDFHGWRIPDWRPLATEQKRAEQREERSAGAGGGRMGSRGVRLRRCPVVLHKTGTKRGSADPRRTTLFSDHLFGLSLCSLLPLSPALYVSLSLSVELMLGVAFRHGLESRKKNLTYLFRVQFT